MNRRRWRCSTSTRPDELILVGAHYDTVDGSPGANDNGSAVAANLEMARAFREMKCDRTVRFAFFVNEEYPYFMTPGMGSLAQTEDASMIPYSVSKAALNMLSRRLHFLLEGDGIAVLAINPGWVKTDMGGPNAQISTEESARGITNVIAGYDRNGEPFQDYLGNSMPW